MKITKITIDEDDNMNFYFDGNDKPFNPIEMVAGTQPHIYLRVIESRIKDFNFRQFNVTV